MNERSPMKSLTAALLCFMTMLAASLRSTVADEQAPVRPNSLGMRFVHVPAGEYVRGFSRDGLARNRFIQEHPFSNSQDLSNETPGHLVKLTHPFEIGTSEVTVGQFAAFVDTTGHVTEAEKSGGYGFVPEEKDYVDRFKRDKQVTWRAPGFAQTDNHPVVCVSWNDAQAFCAWLSKSSGEKYRLPTEAEWEYACRAGSETWYSWGDDPDGAYVHANVADGALEAAFPNMTRYQRAVRLGADEGDGQVFTAAVASFKPNPWGLHDMHGNVWEWCEDRWSEDTYERFFDGVPRTEWANVSVTDPLFVKETSQHKYGDWRVLRGGAWTCAPAAVRSSIRTFAEAGDPAVYTGFRVVRDAR